jgi:hypothetical protein
MTEIQKLCRGFPEARRAAWARDQLAEGAWPDKRHGDRACQILYDLAARPDCHLSAVSAEPAKAKGAYRLLENSRVTAEHVWTPIFGATGRRLAEGQRVVIVQDTTAVMQSNRGATVGLGTAGRAREEALMMHWALAASPRGHVYGAIHSEVWARPLKEFGKRTSYNRRPFEQKESYKWVACARQLHGRPELAKCRLLQLGDRESDVFEVLQALLWDLKDDALIRCSHPERVLTDGRQLREVLQEQPVLEQRTLAVPRRGRRKARDASVTIRSAQLTLAPPANNPNKALVPQPIHVVWVHEPAPPEQAEPLDWMLLTNLPVDTAPQCWEVVNLYKLRWLIEDVHLVLKDGLQIEDTQLKTAQRIEKLLAFCVAVAVLVVQLRQWSRLEPEAPCTVVLSDEQWRVLYLYRENQAYPADRPPPTIREVVRWIGQLGGHLGRKGDGMPGVRTLWQGWCHLEFLVLGYLVAQRQAANGNATA